MTQTVAFEKFKTGINGFLSDCMPSCSGIQKNRVFSYDICRKHFAHPLSENKDVDAVYLFAFLSSWGMLRNTGLMSISPCGLTNTIDVIYETFEYFKDNDIFSIKDEEISDFVGNFEKIADGLDKDKISSSNTMVSKIILGVWGSIPALDTNFNKAFGFYPTTKIEKVICELREAFENIKKTDVSIIHKHLFKPYLNLELEYYGMPKLVDMYGFYVGLKKRKDEYYLSEQQTLFSNI